MRWRQGRRSDNIEDRRGQSGGGFRFPFPMGRSGQRFPGGGLPRRSGGISVVGLIVIVILFFVFGGDLGGLLQQAPVGTNVDPAPRRQTEMPDPNATVRRGGGELADFTSVVLADTEDTWNALFTERGSRYREPTLVLFSGAVRSACGFAQSAVGPFYCPRDQRVYIDLSFFGDLQNRFGAPGDFAQAYVIAHEIGHHVQTLLGISDKVREAQAGQSRTTVNALQVRMELQADCLAGIWAHHADRARNIIEEGDVEEALGAASAIGDDRLQRQAQGYVVPDAFTHGSSAQRKRWFSRGLESGQLAACDTFAAERL
jgi:hypothetical protein